MKIIRKALAGLSILLTFVLFPAMPVFAGSCHNADCGCRDYGITFHRSGSEADRCSCQCEGAVC